MAAAEAEAEQTQEAGAERAAHAASPEAAAVKAAAEKLQLLRAYGELWQAALDAHSSDYSRSRELIRVMEAISQVHHNSLTEEQLTMSQQLCSICAAFVTHDDKKSPDNFPNFHQDVKGGLRAGCKGHMGVWSHNNASSCLRA